jgi:ubiquinone/menaquinone biosynthesis C-methylase UbiE
LSFKGYFERERRNWQNPEIILGSIGLKTGQTIVDVGCGNGFFAIPAAHIVGESGVVFALDLDSHAISELREIASKEGLHNLILKVGKAEETILCKNCADIVFLANDLHDFENPGKVLINAKKMMKSEGLLIDLDWKKEMTGMLGPPLQIRFSEKEASNIIEESGFKVGTIEEAGPYHYLITAINEVAVARGDLLVQ